MKMFCVLEEHAVTPTSDLTYVRCAGRWFVGSPLFCRLIPSLREVLSALTQGMARTHTTWASGARCFVA